MHTARTDNDPRREKGIALVAAVLIVLLSTVMVATFMTTSTGERSIASNVQTAKISLYAADAGIRVNEQFLANIAQTKLDSCLNAWTTAGALPTSKIITAPTALFPMGGITTTATNPPFTSTGVISFQDSSVTDTSQVYNYFFTIQSTGNTRATGLRRVQAQGLLRVSAERGSFADFLLFTNTHTMADGSAIWFTSSVRFDGRVHTNGQFRFAYQPRFDDLVTSVNSRAYFYNNNHPVQANASNYAPYDYPVYGGHFYRGEASVPLPTNTINQQTMAAGAPTAWDPATAPSNADLRGWLGLTAGATPPPNGVYVPRDGLGNVSGGIYIQGAANQVKMWCDTTSNIQYYKVTQGASVWDITVNRTTGQTTYDSPTASAVTYPGTPRGALYCTSGISDLRGPDRAAGVVLPALAEGTKLLVCAAGDVVVQRDITCDSYDKKTNVLGIYSSTGSVRVGTGAPNDCNLDAYIMATGATGQFSVDSYNSGSPRGTFHLRGGMVTQYYGAFYTFNSSGVLQTGFARDFHYDKRGLIPPYYPMTNRFNADRPIARTLSWKEI